MIDIERAIECLENAAGTLETEAVDLTAAAGRILAEEVRTDRDLPPADRSAMDGFAVRSEDLLEPGTLLTVRGEIRAGQPVGDTVVGKGEAAVAALDEFDMVIVHVEAPDEAGHSGDAQAKTEAIAQVDRHIVGPVLEKDGLEPFHDGRRLLGVGTTTHLQVHIGARDLQLVEEQAAHFLVEKRIRVVGLDFISVGSINDHPNLLETHETLLKNGIYILEGNNLRIL